MSRLSGSGAETAGCVGNGIPLVFPEISQSNDRCLISGAGVLMQIVPTAGGAGDVRIRSRASVARIVSSGDFTDATRFQTL